jgi:hypothetical protein
MEKLQDKTFPVLEVAIPRQHNFGVIGKTA